MRTAVDLPTPPAFHFEHTVLSHGWCALLPFRYDPASGVLCRASALPNGRVAQLVLAPAGRGRAACTVHVEGRSSVRDRAALTRAASTMLHLDLDLAPFHRLMRRDPAHAWMARRRAGRMLRGETFFEDVVKMILTTNCSWSLTTAMTTALVNLFGAHDDAGRPAAFPVPAAIAGSSERELRERARLGYRAPYVLALAREVAGGTRDLESFRTSDAPAAELYRALRGILGVGEYAAGNLLKLLGRFDYLALDSWCRSTYARIHNGGTPVPDRAIEAHYAPYGKWQGLVLWLDLTKEWYHDKFPLP